MRRAARVDNTAKALTAAAKQLGADYLPLNDVIDGILSFRGKTWLVDWKSPGGTLTPNQAKLVARGWPIRFISTVEQLQRLLQEKP
jgi:hypothetical protein